ncbi:sodium:solute symporter family protein [Roseateles amylovorans]|uniref:Cation acetate symporter n=1 Tax=Roseateles amylovorans TaxID=2978473 RepID=A0ABY6AX99_9BURK|nr:sodium:solute symporter family protein [Roseateles amylovorans]UXH77034.1 cation acetate symporter [Roseateles amylovorans]
MSQTPDAAFRHRLNRNYAAYTVGFVLLVVVLGVLERWGMSKQWLGFSFLLLTVLVYACIGVFSRTTDPVEYYVAGRRVPAFYNGMAAGADWMSAASFLGMAGSLYLAGYGGLAFILGWTGGFCLVALLLAPYLRRFGQFTVPDFLGERFDSRGLRVMGAAAAVLVSFIYVVAQIYAIGLITTRLTGLTFEIGVFVGLGGVLVCSFLGGMRAVTWTQVAQYIIMILAYVLPVMWLSMQQTGWPLPQLTAGRQLHQITAREQVLLQDPAERQVMALHEQRARDYERLVAELPQSLDLERQRASQHIAQLKSEDAPLAQIQAAEKQRASLPRTEVEAREQWLRAARQQHQRSEPLAGMPPHARPFAGDPAGTPQEREAFDLSRRNFLALVFVLMVGTAGLPHILTRYYTTPSVAEARTSVAWSLFFIALLYLSAPALAVLLKYEVFNHLVGMPIAELPSWVRQWMRVDPGLLSIQDINHDGLLQLGELRLGGDVVMLLTPELAGLPYVLAAMVAAGALAAALSTADGLLLTISSALSHDIYYRVINPRASMTQRVMVSKALLLATALTAAAVAAQKPADILLLVSAAFSLAGASLVPVLVGGIFWPRANKQGAGAAMLVGLGVTLYYMITAHPGLRQAIGLPGEPQLWWGIQPVSAALFGVPAGVVTLVIVSLMTPPPSVAARAVQAQVVRPG